MDDGLLLRASDLLELGDPSFRSVLGEFAAGAEASRQPRLRYAAMLRRAMLAAFDRLPEAGEFIERAYRYGEQIGQHDAADARLAQLWPLYAADGRLGSLAADVEIVFPRHNEPAGRTHRILLRLAAGDTDAARTLAAPLRDADLGALPRNASWLVAMAYLADIASGLADPALAALVYDQLAPYAGGTVVVGAAVSCLGTVDHYLGRLAEVQERRADRRTHLARAAGQYDALGAFVQAAAIRVPDREAAPPGEGVFRRDGGRWTVGLGGTTVRLRHAKGIADLAVLLAAPGRPVPTADLAAAAAGEQVRAALGFGSDPVLDSRARRELRARLRDLTGEEREAVLGELRQATGLGGRGRRLGDPAERARKAVTARIRDAITRIDAVHPELGAHLRDAVTTGTFCTYSPASPVRWRF